jgi:hypothetical protein
VRRKQPRNPDNGICKRCIENFGIYVGKKRKERKYPSSFWHFAIRELLKVYSNSKKPLVFFEKSSIMK